MAFFGGSWNGAAPPGKAGSSYLQETPRSRLGLELAAPRTHQKSCRLQESQIQHLDLHCLHSRLGKGQGSSNEIFPCAFHGKSCAWNMELLCGSLQSPKQGGLGWGQDDPKPSVQEVSGAKPSPSNPAGIALECGRECSEPDPRPLCSAAQPRKGLNFLSAGY